jgi:beta-fructofuranosidase
LLSISTKHGLYTSSNSSSLGKELYKPSFAGFVDVDLTDKKLSLRSLVWSFHYLSLKQYLLLLCSHLRNYLNILLVITLSFQIDHSVVESFGAGGRIAISSRVYPTIAVFEKAHLYVFNNGSEAITVENLNAWSMNTPVMNVPVKS